MIKKTYYAKKVPLPCTKRDIDRLKEDADLGVLDIDYAKWVEAQAFYWREEASDLERRVKELENKYEKNPDLSCSFCGKAINEIKKLIAGPAVYICNECVDICVEIIVEDSKSN